MIFGPKLWCIFNDLARLARGKPEVRPLFNQFAKCLQFVLSCIYCRQSFTKYLRANPVEHATDPALWVHQIHNSVQDKLERPKVLSWEEFEKRMATWTTFSSEFDVWDICFIFVLNFPDLQVSGGADGECSCAVSDLTCTDYDEQIDQEYDEKLVLRKQFHYTVFFYALSRMLEHLDTHKSIAKYITLSECSCDNFYEKATFLSWLLAGRREWSKNTGKENIKTDEDLMFQYSHAFAHKH